MLSRQSFLFIDSPGVGANCQGAVESNHVGEDVEHRLGYRFVVDCNQIPRLRIHFQRFVEAEGCLDMCRL